jgi:hypothetical protein
MVMKLIVATEASLRQKKKKTNIYGMQLRECKFVHYDVDLRGYDVSDTAACNVVLRFFQSIVFNIFCATFCLYIINW